MKQLVGGVLGLEQYDEKAMDEKIEKAVIRDYTVTFHFRDGTTKSCQYVNKKRDTKHTGETRQRMSEIMKQKWRERKRESNHNPGKHKPVYGKSARQQGKA